MSVDTVVAITFGILAAVFVVTLAALFVICYRRLSNKQTSTLFNFSEFSPESILVPRCGIDGAQRLSEFELDDVMFAPQIKRILNDAQWVDDATGLIPHSLGILRLCHHLTEKLTVPAMAGRHKARLHEMIQLSRRIYPRIDDIASAMYPPLDPRLLEARCYALVMALHVLVLNARPTTPKNVQENILETLSEMEDHLKVLRDAALNHETVQRVFREENANTEMLG